MSSYRRTIRMTAAPPLAGGALKLQGDDIHGYHSIQIEEEQVAFAGWLNRLLKDDKDVAHLLPIAEDGCDMYGKIDDGIILCKVVNFACPGTIDHRAINKGSDLTTFHKHENITLAVQSAKSIGITVINMDSHSLSSTGNKKWLVIGLLWQLIEMYLFKEITLNKHPELVLLCLPDETYEDLCKLSHEALLLRWINYHMEKAGSCRRARNFTGDIKDSEIYTELLCQIAPADLGVDKSAMEKRLLGERAEAMLCQADKMGCREFVTAQDVKNGHQRLNLAFCANLFNKYPGLRQPEVEACDLALPTREDLKLIEETREEKTYRNWINSLGFDPYVDNLYDGLRDGLLILQIMDLIQPGIVDWNCVVEEHQMAKGVQRKYEMLANCNYAITLGKQMGFSLVGIAGEDIWKGNKTLTLALTWQLMRAYTLSLLKRDNRDVTEEEIISWANEEEKKSGKTHTIKDFKDKEAIKTALPVLDLIDCIKPGTVDYSNVVDKPDSTDEENLENAKYAISCGRKIGAPVFALPEDIVEDNSKMVFTIYAALKFTYDVKIVGHLTH